MKNFTKAFLISLLMSGSFMVNAAEYTDEEMAAMATHCEMSVSDLHELGKSMSLEEFYKPVAHLFDRDSSKLTEQLNRWTITTRQDEPAAFQNRNYTPQHTPHASEMANTAGYSDEQMAAMATHWAMSFHDLRQLEKTMSLAEFYSPVAHQFALQRQEDTSNDHQLALELDREAKAEANYHSTLQFLEKEKQTAAPAWNPTPVKEKIHAQTWEFSQEPAKRAILEKFMTLSKEITAYLDPASEDMRINKSLNVHALDAYVFGARKAINDVLEVGRLYGAEEPILTLAEVRDQMTSFLNENRNFFDDFTYEHLISNDYISITLNSDAISSHLKTHFSNMDNEIKAYSPEAREVWSRAWTLALHLRKTDNDIDAMRFIYESTLEGVLTNGGCVQGRINRGFIAYFRLLAKAGVTLDPSYIGFAE